VQEFHSTPIAQLGAEANQIWNDFLERNAPYEINIEAPVKERIRKILTEGDVNIDLFDQAQDRALNLLRFSVYPLWKGSEACKVALQKHGVPNLERLVDKLGKGRSSELPLAERTTFEIFE